MDYKRFLPFKLNHAIFKMRSYLHITEITPYPVYFTIDVLSLRTLRTCSVILVELSSQHKKFFPHCDIKRGKCIFGSKRSQLG